MLPALQEMTLWNRRSAKILTALVSFFTANYVMLWPQYMQSPSGKPELLQYPPQFDGRLVVYPSRKNIRDYLSWRCVNPLVRVSLLMETFAPLLSHDGSKRVCFRSAPDTSRTALRQADCHINNLFNTCFWKLVLDGGKTPIEAEGILSKTLSNEKNEILFSQFGVNYNNEPAMFRRGSILLRRTVLVDKVVGGNGVSADNDCDSSASPVSDDPSRQKVAAEDSASPNPRRPSPGTVIKVKRKRVAVVHDDLISDTFWSENEDIFPREG